MADEYRFYVYTLAYEDGTVFYVGKGTGTRARQHEWEAARLPLSIGDTSYPAPVAAIRQAWRGGNKVIRCMVRDHISALEALLLEAELIAEYDSDKLVNVFGGHGRRQRRKSRVWGSTTSSQ